MFATTGKRHHQIDAVVRQVIQTLSIDVGEASIANEHVLPGYALHTGQLPVNEGVHLVEVVHGGKQLALLVGLLSQSPGSVAQGKQEGNDCQQRDGDPLLCQRQQIEPAFDKHQCEAAENSQHLKTFFASSRREPHSSRIFIALPCFADPAVAKDASCRQRKNLPVALMQLAKSLPLRLLPRIQEKLLAIANRKQGRGRQLTHCIGYFLAISSAYPPGMANATWAAGVSKVTRPM